MNKNAQTLNRDDGFSLLEMLVALCLIAMSATIMWPRIGSSRQAMTLRATAIDVASSLKLVRAAAIANNSDAVLVIDTTRRQYSAAGFVKTKPIPRSLSLSFSTQAAESAGPTRGGFRFRPDGSSSGGNIKLTGAAATATVSVDWLTGAVTMKMQ